MSVVPGRVTITVALWSFGLVLLIQSLVLAAFAAISLWSLRFFSRREPAPRKKTLRPAPPQFVRIEWVE